MGPGAPSTVHGVGELADPNSLNQLLEAVLTVSSDLDLPAMLRRIVENAVTLVDARYGALGVLDFTGTRLSQFITVGLDENQQRAIGELPDGHGILGLLILDAQPIRLPDLSLHPDSFGFPPGHPAMRSFLGVPIRLRDEVFGNLYLTDKTTAEQFSTVDQELVVGLAAAAGVAIENARLHAQLHDLAVVEDRERIARDLHDTVIQRLFATGMSLQTTARLIQTDPVEASQRIEAAVDDLDVTVKQIRTAIFGLEQSRNVDDGLRARILRTAREAMGPLGFEPRVLLDGPIDFGVEPHVGSELLATLREALSNVARHASASEVDVEVVVAKSLTMVVTDNGTGPPDETAPRGNGLHNMADRAARLGGSFEITRSGSGGTQVTWRVPKG